MVRDGLDWLGNVFAVSGNPSEDRASNYFHYYYLYGVERVGRMTAQRFFFRSRARAGEPDRHDWYRAGADYLVGRQSPDGSWKEDRQYPPHIGSSLALLFLSKGRRPVLISKLQREGNDWRRLRHEVANLTRYTEKQWKIPLTWQIVDSRTARAGDYAQSAVLFMSGNAELDVDDDQVRELRAYVDNGGFIFADACCGNGEFDQSFRELMRRVFPEPQLQLRPLEPEHPIWSIEEIPDPQFINPDERWLEGINVGCRTSVVYCPYNLSCFWEVGGSRQMKRLSKAARAEVAACRSVGINVLAYATNRELRDKDSVPRPIVESTKKHPTERGHFAIAKLRHAGGCDAAPRALVNLMRSVEGELEIRTVQQPKLINISDEQVFDYHFLFLHGRHDFRLNAKEVQQLRTFIERGGMILADSICGSQKFADAVRREMARVLPKHQLKRIPPTDPIMTPAYGGSSLANVRRREAFQAENGPMEMRQQVGPPILEGAIVEDRYAVILSPFDLSCALELQASPQCRGYLTEDAKRIGINVILYSLHE